MRLSRVVARAALTAALASVVVPGLVGSHIPSAPQTIDPSAFETVELGADTTMTTTLSYDTAIQSAGRLDASALLREPLPAAAPAAPLAGRPNAAAAAKAIVVETWKLDNNISWYGPGFWGHGGACGMFGANGFDPGDVGVAHRTLPCGTRITMRYNGITVVTRVVDRGPYVAGRIFDMTRGLCEALHHCFTGGGVYYRIG